jgi:hypothetical protein
MPARRTVRAGLVRSIDEELVQRVEPHEAGALARHDLRRIGEIGEVADAPVTA